MFENSNRYAWERFYFYTDRVYEFTEIQDFVDYQILGLLINASKAKKRCIFPNLQFLNNLHIYEFSPPILFERLIAPSLRFLQVIVQGPPMNDSNHWKPDDILCKVFDILTIPSHDGSDANQSAQLQHLELSATPLPSSCLDQLASLRQLRILHLKKGVTPEYIEGVDYLRRLSTLPYLHDLCLAVEEDEYFHRVPQDGFPSLERLVLQGKPSSLQSLLRALPSNRLKVIGIYDVVNSWAPLIPGAEELRICLQEWCACFGELAQQAGTLTALYIRVHSDAAKPDDAKACAADLPMMSILKPLLELRKLQVVELAGFMQLPYSDVDVRDIAVAWPEIQHMAFPPPFAEVMQPSLMSLRLLSRFCPNLHSLSIWLDLNAETDVEPNSELLQQLNTLPVVTNHALMVLNVNESYLRKEDVTTLANQLGDWFPLLRNVVASQSEVAAEISMALQENTGTSHFRNCGRG